MKKIFIVFLILVVVAVASAGIFLATFDAERYKPLLIERLEKVLGNAVSIGRISLAWEGGVSLQLKDLKIASDAGSLENPAVSLERLSAKMRFWPLLKKKIEIQSIVLERPRLTIVKTPGGSLWVDNMNPRPSTASTAAKDTPGVLPVFSIDVIRVERGEIIYLDRASSKPLEIPVRLIDAAFKNVAFETPVDFEIQAAIMAERPNSEFKGAVKIMGPSGPYRLQDFKAAVNLEGVKTGEIKDARGVLGFGIERLEIDQKGLENLSASFDLREGSIFLASLPAPLKDLSAQGTVTKNEIEVSRFSATLAGGGISAKAKTSGYLLPGSSTALEFQLKGLNLQELLPSSRAEEPGLSGKLSLASSANAQGLSWPEISRTLTGSGEITLTEGLITNFNVLKTVLNGLSKVPGVSETLQTQLPAHYYAVLDKPYTVIHPISFPVSAQNGTLLIPNIKIGFEGFDLFGSGQMNLSGQLDFNAWLVLAPDLSAILVTSVPQMRYVADNYGNVVVPVRVQSDGKKMKVTPDMDYVFKRVLATKGQELLSDVLGGNSQSASSSGASQQQSLLAGLFQ